MGGLLRSAWRGTRTYVLAGLAIGVIVSLAGYGVWSVWHAWRVREEAAVSKTWPTSGLFDEATVELTTSCAGSVLAYIVLIVPPISRAVTLPDRIDQSKVKTDRIRLRLEAIRLELVEGKGTAPIVAIEPRVDDFVRIYSTSDRRLTSLEARGTVSCDAASYMRAERLRVTWRERPE
jgi:hypothetical protein